MRNSWTKLTAIGHSEIRWKPVASFTRIFPTTSALSVGKIWTQPLDGSPPRQLIDLGTAPIFSFDWSRDGRWLAYANGTLIGDVVLISDIGR
jgi:hypothetical protein